jgi:ABC-type lipoprotein release transport system permease subunit
MYRPLALFLGLRYGRARRSNGFLSFISAASILGIALGVMALILGLSAMNGFERELRERVLAEGRRRVHVNPVWTSEEEIGCQGFLQDDMFLSDRFIDELIKGD